MLATICGVVGAIATGVAVFYRRRQRNQVLDQAVSYAFEVLQQMAEKTPSSKDDQFLEFLYQVDAFLMFKMRANPMSASERKKVSSVFK